MEPKDVREKTAIDTEVEAEAVEEVKAEGHTGAPAKPSTAATSPRMSKLEQARAKVARAEERIGQTDEEIEACLSKIEEDLNGFKQAESYLFDHALHTSQTLLKEVGVGEHVLESVPAPKVDLEDPTLSPVAIKKLSSGTGKGLLWGLLGGVVALGGWCYAATQALGLPLIPETFPDTVRLTRALEWTSGLLGQGKNAAVGGTVVVVAILFIMGLIYWLTKTLTAAANLKTATRIEEDAEFYCTKKGECKAQMEKVREHIAHARKMVEKYEALLAEQNAALQRALFIEEPEGYDQLHAKTRQTVQTIQKLTSEIERFLETPMAESGILSKEGIAILERANKAANDHVLKLYA